MKLEESDAGTQLFKFAEQLYPICRSITGAGLRKTLGMIKARIPLSITEVPSGSKVFDWEVPLEWNIEDAFVKDADGRRVVDFQAHNLHLVSYSEPVREKLTLEQLRPQLHAHSRNPDWIPYRTSYYRRNWGFCLCGRDLAALRKGHYEVRIDSSLAQGSLTYGEFVLPGRSREEVLLFTHICHPSLANDNTSGMAIATALAIWLAEQPRRFTYRLVFAPGTIGSLCWLKRNQTALHRVRNGMVLGLLGDNGALTYKKSRRGDCEIDSVARYVINEREPAGRVVEFEPYGYDERQLCSPGFNLPVGRLTRSVNDGYPEYHSSADNLELISPHALASSLEACKQIIDVLENDRRYINLKPKGEPRLGKRGLYGAVGGQSPATRERAMLWVLNQSDGANSLLQIAERSGVAFATIREAAGALAQAKLLRESGAGTKPRKPPVRGKSKERSNAKASRLDRSIDPATRARKNRVRGNKR